jgi:periplasmic protein TonB
MRQLRAAAIATGTGRESPQLFQSLVLTAPGRDDNHKSATLVISMGIHSTLALALAILPLLLGNALPSPGTLDTFFPTPLEIAVLPPPPPPAGDPKATRPVRRVEPSASGLVAPINISSEIRRDDPFGARDGDPNGVDGGVLCPGCEVGVVVHVPDPVAPPPPPKVVRISQLEQPKPVVHVDPRYPRLAADIGLSGTVVVEAEVDTAGRVKTARVLSGHPLLNEAALEAVTQWRYRPLLLSGEPTGFILTVTVEFRIQRR